MNEPAELSRAATSLQPYLQTVGFRPHGKHPEWSGKVYLRSWSREVKWKRDEITCSCRPGPDSIAIGASWSIPGREDGKVVLVSAINSGYMCRQRPDYPVPLRLPVLGGILERRWLSKLLEDVRRTVRWLDGCASRAGALAELERADRNGPARGTPVYEWAEHYIREHAR